MFQAYAAANKIDELFQIQSICSCNVALTPYCFFSFETDAVGCLPGADTDNIEHGGVNSISYQTEPGGANLFFVLHIRANRGRAPGTPPLNPRLVTDTIGIENIKAIRGQIIWPSGLFNSEPEQIYFAEIGTITTKLTVANNGCYITLNLKQFKYNYCLYSHIQIIIDVFVHSFYFPSSVNYRT